jgi:hypothetical protein
MGQRNRRRTRNNLACRLKSGNKKTIDNMKIIHSRVAAEYKDINERVTKLAEDID